MDREQIFDTMALTMRDYAAKFGAPVTDICIPRWMWDLLGAEHIAAWRMKHGGVRVMPLDVPEPADDKVQMLFSRGGWVKEPGAKIDLTSAPDGEFVATRAYIELFRDVDVFLSDPTTGVRRQRPPASP